MHIFMGVLAPHDRAFSQAARGPAPGAHVFEPLHLTPDL